MAIDNDGRVGIGTTSPSQLVHAYAASGDVMYMIETAGSSKGRWGFMASDNGDLYIRNDYSGGYPIAIASGSDF